MPESIVTIKEIPDSVLTLVRALCEHKLKREPGRTLLSKIAVSSRAPIRKFRETRIRPNYDGQQFTHFVSGSTVTVESRNIYGKLVLKWANNDMTVIDDREFEVAFTAKP